MKPALRFRQDLEYWIDPLSRCLMLSRLMYVGALVVCLVSTVGCASSSGSSSAQGTPKDVLTPAKMKSSGGPAIMYMPAFHGTVEVPIDETGRPLTSEA